MNTENRRSMRDEQVIAFRLASHNLARRMSPGSLLTAGAVCGVQNTPPGSAAQALHARVNGLTQRDVDSALLDEKSLLQVWSLRAAPHVIPTTDIAPFTSGLLPLDEGSARAFIFGAGPALEKVGISILWMVELSAAALLAELDGRVLTKDELGVRLADRIAPQLSASQREAWVSPSWYAPGQSQGESLVRFVLPLLSLRGLCCHAARAGGKAYHARTDQWLDAPLAQGEPNLARAGLVRRYLRAYGPSTTEHFAGWAGIAPSQAAQAWSLVESELAPVQLEGRQTWLLEADLPALESPPQPAGVRFLPPHEPFLQLRDRATLIPDKTRQRRIWRTAGAPGMVLADGRGVATWQAVKKGSRLEMKVEAFEQLAPALWTEVEAEAESLAAFRVCRSVEIHTYLI